VISGYCIWDGEGTGNTVPGKFGRPNLQFLSVISPDIE